MPPRHPYNLPPSVIEGATSFADKYAAPVAAAMAEEARAKRLQDLANGKIGRDRLQDGDAESLIAGVTRRNLQERANQARAIFGGTPFERSIMATIQAAAYDALPAEDKAKHSAAIAAAVMQMRTDAAAFRKQTGFGRSIVKRGMVQLLDDDDRPVTSLAPDTAQNLTEPRFQPALAVLKAAAQGKAIPLDALTAAIQASEGDDRAIGDGMLFMERADRIAAAERIIATLTQPNISPTARTPLLQALFKALAEEAYAHRRTAQAVLDAAPIIGNIRSGEAAYESAQGVGDALAAGDYGRAASKLGNAAIHAADAAGGLVTPIIGMANRAVRATVARAAQNTAKDLLEAGHATFVGKEAAAQARVEKMANRPGVTQL